VFGAFIGEAHSGGQAALGKLVTDICHDNAAVYFGLEYGRFPAKA